MKEQPVDGARAESAPAPAGAPSALLRAGSGKDAGQVPQSVLDALADAATLRLNYPERFVSPDYAADNALRWMRAVLRSKAPNMARYHARNAASMVFERVPALRDVEAA